MLGLKLIHVSLMVIGVRTGVCVTIEHNLLTFRPRTTHELNNEWDAYIASLNEFGNLLWVLLTTVLSNSSITSDISIHHYHVTQLVSELYFTHYNYIIWASLRHKTLTTCSDLQPRKMGARFTKCQWCSKRFQELTCYVLCISRS